MDQRQGTGVDEVTEEQMTILDLGIADGFDCQGCIWMKTYGYCYPEETLGRRYYIKINGKRRCSDFCTAFASVK